MEYTDSEIVISASGVRLFIQATTSLMVSCLEVGRTLPEHILALIAEVAKRADLSDPPWRYYETLMMLTNFRADVRRGVVSHPPEVLATALEIDKAALSIFAEAPSRYEYETIYTNAEPGVVFAGCYHVYQDYLSATIWNGMRAIRLMLHEIIRDILLKPCPCGTSFSTDEQYKAQLQLSTDIMYQMQSDIIASVPQHLGYAPTKSTSAPTSEHSFPWSHFNKRLPTSQQTPGLDSAGPPMIRVFGGYTLPWALYIAGAIDIATEPVRLWIIETLQRMGRSMGIQQAIVLADKLHKEDTGA